MHLGPLVARSKNKKRGKGNGKKANSTTTLSTRKAPLHERIDRTHLSLSVLEAKATVAESDLVAVINDSLSCDGNVVDSGHVDRGVIKDRHQHGLFIDAEGGVAPRNGRKLNPYVAVLVSDPRGDERRSAS